MRRWRNENICFQRTRPFINLGAARENKVKLKSHWKVVQTSRNYYLLWYRALRIIQTEKLILGYCFTRILLQVRRFLVENPLLFFFFFNYPITIKRKNSYSFVDRITKHGTKLYTIWSTARKKRIHAKDLKRWGLENGNTRRFCQQKTQWAKIWTRVIRIDSCETTTTSTEPRKQCVARSTSHVHAHSCQQTSNKPKVTLLVTK